MLSYRGILIRVDMTKFFFVSDEVFPYEKSLLFTSRGDDKDFRKSPFPRQKFFLTKFSPFKVLGDYDLTHFSYGMVVLNTEIVYFFLKFQKF